MKFTIVNQVDLTDTTVTSLRDQDGKVWTLTATSHGEDVLTHPDGKLDRLDYGYMEGPIEVAVTEALAAQYEMTFDQAEALGLDGTNRF